MRYSTILIPPTLAMPPTDPMTDGKHFRTIGASVDGQKLPYSESTVVQSLEHQLNRMVSNCATKIWMPADIPPAWGSTRSLRRNVSPSIRVAMGFADRRRRLWSALEKFLEPVGKDIARHSKRLKDIVAPDHSYESADIEQALRRVFWATYLTSLAAKQKSQTFLDPKTVVAAISFLESKAKFRSESKARLSRLKGLFLTFEVRSNLDTFVCLPPLRDSLLDRVDEILEDAYLLQASHLRTFLGATANIASVKRDVRKLVKLIARRSAWAKGCVSVASSTLTLPADTAKIAGSLSNIFEGSFQDKSAPVLILPSSLSRENSKGERVLVQEVGRMPFGKGFMATTGTLG